MEKAIHLNPIPHTKNLLPRPSAPPSSPSSSPSPFFPLQIHSPSPPLLALLPHPLLPPPIPHHNGLPNSPSVAGPSSAPSRPAISLNVGQPLILQATEPIFYSRRRTRPGPIVRPSVQRLDGRAYERCSTGMRGFLKPVVDNPRYRGRAGGRRRRTQRPAAIGGF
ncbi:uncharacterized protein A4U43_C07F9480 [Asparagus officinalis]|uniref:Uncharacterized protein n=1 Tax=Asparagus officinalis TaxID=4686 RepID=A0A5P1EDP2_ASPOF|nr:uncharacterized protein A4U43_C07F9480 [Asparagus officinalis]